MSGNTITHSRARASILFQMETSEIFLQQKTKNNMFLGSFERCRIIDFRNEFSFFRKLSVLEIVLPKATPNFAA